MARHHPLQLTLALLCLLIVLLGTLPVSAQCSVPAGLQAYTVQRGDNLYRIAQRFSTTVATIQATNCLTSTRINAGQILYVPQGAGLPTPVPNNGTVWRTTQATFQPFENGFMIWLADTSDIWVFTRVVTSVKTRNSLNVHAASEYSRLTSNVVTPPSGYIQPVFGFGKVWSNLNNYRQTMGWATQSETAYTLRFGILNRQLVEFNLPNGTTMLRQSDGFWSDMSTTPPLSSPGVRIDTPASQATLVNGQSFTVTGQAAGLFEASFVLELRAVPSGALLESAIMTYNAPEVGLAGPWQTRLTPTSYVGAAEMRAIYTQPRDGTQVVLAVLPVTFR